MKKRKPAEAGILTYRDYLKDSKRFDKVIEAIEKNKDKKFKEKYTQDNDITIEPVDGNKGYIKALNDATSPNSTKTISSWSCPSTSMSRQTQKTIWI